MRNSTYSQLQKSASEKLTNHAKKSLLEADRLAKKFRHSDIGALHLLYAIYLEGGSLGSNILKDIGIKEKSLSSALAKMNFNPKNAPSENTIKNIVTRAYSIAKKFSYSYVGTEHLIYAIIQSQSKEIARIISDVSLENLAKSVNSFFDPSQFSNIPQIFEVPEIIVGKKSQKKISPTPFIDKFCRNINKEAKEKGEIIIGREKEISRIINILGRKNKNNPLLMGEPGVGKTALISGLAQLVNSSSVPHCLYRKKIMGLDVAQLIAGTGFRGEFENRLKEIIKEAARSKNIILFIDEIHTIVGAGNIPGGLDLANIIKPALARGEVQIIGATTFSEYKKYIEKDMALERRFQSIQIEEPNEQETKKILFGIRKNYENFHDVVISDKAIGSAIELSVRYIQNRFLPDKVIDVIDETASHARSKHRASDFLREIATLENEKLSLLEKKEKMVTEEDYAQAIFLREKEKEIETQIKTIQEKHFAKKKENPIHINSQDIMETVSQMAKIPLEKITQEKNKKIKNIQKILEKQIIGQKEIIEKINYVLLRSQSGISDPDRPLGSFLFLGPTGVGKTLSASLLAKEFFGNKQSLIRIDMSELMERHNVSSLIGSPAGYVGYGEGGRLTEKVRRNPHSVILFDEIEKAHPDVFNILLQILEDGVLTDAEGTRVDFKNTIVILTSNIGTADFTNASQIGFGSENKALDMHKKFNEIKSNTLVELEKKIRPELLNRLDHIIVFNALGEKEIQKITQNETIKLVRRIEKQKIKVTVAKEVMLFIAGKSLIFNQGARLVRKNIQELLENPIAEMIVYDKVIGNRINVSIKDGKVKLA
ncbi:MAG TPA: ATP-dependent Clp protease ATP-binding subunit ClpC [Candidatus Moranbacteria bacterium]|nr:ATP-dependent Clp protease ATP-binding subunit ClpC [Candidatus Moranbacteria bacterium]